MQQYQLIDVFYKLLSNIKDDEGENSEVLQDIIRSFGELAKFSECRQDALRVGALQYILENVLKFNAIIQSVAVMAIYKFFSNFSNLDFAMIEKSKIFKISEIPKILVKLLEKAEYYEDSEMQQE